MTAVLCGYNAHNEQTFRLKNVSRRDRMKNLTFEQVEDVSGGWVPIALGVLTAISAIDAAVDAYRGYRDGVQQAKLEASQNSQ